jgi:hypothetical protein
MAVAACAEMLQESDHMAADIQVFHPDELQFAKRLQKVETCALFTVCLVCRQRPVDSPFSVIVP